MRDPEVIHDPLFEDLMRRHQSNATKLTDAVIALRSYHLNNTTKPLDQTAAQKWKTELLASTAKEAHDNLVESAAQLLRYGFELAPYANTAEHLNELDELRTQHRRRVEKRSGYGQKQPHPRGIEEKVAVDGGAPITLVIDPKHYNYTEKARRAQKLREPAKNPEDGPE